MIDRTRAWRRRNSRRVLAKVKATRDWLVNQFDATGKKVERPHRPGKLTQAQKLRQKWATIGEVRDGFVEA